MSTPSPMTVAEWRAFLGDYSVGHIDSDEAREAIDKHRQVISEQRLEAGWAGGEPAGEETIVAAEERLGVRFPPSYRNFLQVSDGWESLGFVDLFQVEDIGWFADLYADLVEAWSDSSFVDHLALVKRCLLIADDDGGSGCYWLLHADSIGENGEWTAYVWWPGDGGDPEPYHDFAAMVRQAVHS
ncbi:SMI1/KNR4 family protein [Streptomyces sp. NBC_01433]|uniref:SMI1/KNR4 family protein n=1 Tax=Streptomyces sp. NBC_01433 TaxID=2903864 RepID=UPI0022564498|nr:SMI1/KNR4 family protein [Streptomyces sp. NBC_01433]MCX4681964.1 SMI1/KNR4 family protein [Streptomyces sp. NBC_01433]